MTGRRLGNTGGSGQDGRDDRNIHADRTGGAAMMAGFGKAHRVMRAVSIGIV